jgi:hypothetical protein
MKLVLYFYNAIEGEEELHEDEDFGKNERRCVRAQW